jgi:hypothetical protein
MMNPQACGIELLVAGVVALCAWCKRKLKNN